MRRTATDIEIPLAPRQDNTGLQDWLYSELRKAILEGKLAPGCRLPATRELAHKQRISRTTVLAVYDQLTAEGYIVGQSGRGSFVSPSLPEQRVQSIAVNTGENAGNTHTPELSARGRLLAQTPFAVNGKSANPKAFRIGTPDLENFPFELWSKIAARRYRLANRKDLADSEALGYYPLRKAIADHLRTTRGIICSAEHIAILSSVQQIIDLCARLMLDPGDAAWLEDPGYPGARRILEAAQARIINVPVDHKGLVVSTGKAKGPHAKLAYVTVGRQFPTGIPLALDRRLELLDWARQANALIIEDDYDSEFRFEGAPLAALKSVDANNRVMYTGTFSKLLFPSLRLAYMLIPDPLREAFAAAISASFRFTSVLPQVVLYEFISEGHFGRHIRRMRLIYQERAQALKDAETLYWQGLLEVPGIVGGLYTPAYLPHSTNPQDIAGKAEQAGIETWPLGNFAAECPVRPGLILGFAPVTPEEIDKAAAKLGRIIEASLKP